MTDQSLLAAWGLTTTAGYLATHAMGVAGTELLGLSVFGSIVAVWALLMLPPVVLSAALAARRRTDAHHWVWVGLVVAALAANVGVAASGGGHTHGESGHDSASAGAPSHGEPGPHDGSADLGGTPATASAEGSDGGGHAHPDGGHGGDPGPNDGAGDGSGDHAHPDGGHAEAGGTEAQATPNETAAPADSAGGAVSASASDPTNGGSGHGESDGGLFDAAGLQHAAYFHLWFLVGALGFAFSAGVAHGGARRTLYGLAALLNALMVVALVAVPGTREAAFLIAAAVQGLPMLLDLPLRARQPAA